MTLAWFRCRGAPGLRFLPDPPLLRLAAELTALDLGPAVTFRASLRERLLSEAAALAGGDALPAAGAGSADASFSACRPRFRPEP